MALISLGPTGSRSKGRWSGALEWDVAGHTIPFPRDETRPLRLRVRCNRPLPSACFGPLPGRRDSSLEVPGMPYEKVAVKELTKGDRQELQASMAPRSQVRRPPLAPVTSPPPQPTPP
jgi:hypothetical protein